MHLTHALLLPLASLFALGASSPLESSDGHADAARAITHLYVCTDINFGGRCQNLETSTGQCYNLGNGFDNDISSLGPDDGTTCTVWNNPHCNGARLGGIVYPGINDLRAYNFNDEISSYSCA